MAAQNDALLALTDDEVSQAEDMLRGYLEGLRIDVDEESIAKEIVYLRLLLEKTKYLNLTAVKDFHKGIILHIIDSLLYLKPIYKYGSLRYDDAVEDEMLDFVDIGSGGGMPGIPLALASEDMRGVLDDSTKKKMTAVQEFVEHLGLQDRVSVSTDRIEELPYHYADGFSLVVARAVGSLPVLLEYASPLLIEDGILVVSKGTPSWEEMRAADKVEKMVGMGHIATEEYDLPEGYGHRTLLIYGKMEEPKIRLPRAVGMAKKQPLV